MKRRNKRDFKGMMGLIGILSILTLVVFLSGCTNPGTNATMSEADFKAACQEVPVSDLVNNPSQHAGQKIKCTGEVGAMNFKATNNSTELILAVNDPTNILSSGVLPVYVYYGIYDNSTVNWINKNVTVYGEFYTNDTFGSGTIMENFALNSQIKSGTLKDKMIPRINARFIDF